MSPSRSLIRGQNRRVQGWDRTRPFGRWSYARPGANPAQGNLNSMPQIVGLAKSREEAADLVF
ncbi:hypothetical protein BST30_03880 [Mycobacterium mantenii]|uniref:Uncharacterized protein n=1 Tax=Mycobacterium mantenii TaxID=560555 RepID=A0A1X0G4I0_MYCNT|nr:hypothetical protein BST30_03880 [Mycobacterium mantenii]